MAYNQKMFGLGSKRSVIRELFEYGKQRKAEIGAENVYDFSLGNPSVNPPSSVRETLQKLLLNPNETELHGYTSAQGDALVRKTISDNYKQKYGFELDPNLMYMTCGAAASLCIALNALICDEKDEVIAFAPFFPEYRVFAEKAGAKLVVCPPSDNLKIDAEAFASVLNENTRAVIINSPNNPSGVIYSEEEIKAVADALSMAEKKYAHPIYLIADEPYRELVFDGIKVACLPSYYDDTIICYSYSKSLSIPGERIGYVAISPKAQDCKEVYISACGAGRALGYVCAPALFQFLVKECDKDKSDINIYMKNRDILYGALSKYGFTCAYPAGAFYLFVKAPSGDATEFSEEAKKHEILVVPSDDFGCKGYVRIAYCVSTEQIEKSLPAFEDLAKHYFNK